MSPKKPVNSTPKPKARSPKAPDNQYDRASLDTRKAQLEGNQQGSKRPGENDQGGPPR